MHSELSTTPPTSPHPYPAIFNKGYLPRFLSVSSTERSYGKPAAYPSTPRHPLGDFSAAITTKIQRPATSTFFVLWPLQQWANVDWHTGTQEQGQVQGQGQVRVQVQVRKAFNARWEIPSYILRGGQAKRLFLEEASNSQASAGWLWALLHQSYFLRQQSSPSPPWQQL